MPTYDVEVSARALGWLRGVEADTPEAAIEIASRQGLAADWDMFDDVEVEDVIEVDET